MTTENRDEQEGVVIEALPSTLFLVELDSKEQIVTHLSGEPTRNFVRIRAGDRVIVTLSPRHRTRGRITSRRS